MHALSGLAILDVQAQLFYSAFMNEQSLVDDRGESRATTTPSSNVGNTLQSPEGFDAIHADMLRNFHNLVVELGGKPAAVLSKIGLEHSRRSKGGPRATYRQFVALLETAAADLNCPDFGMRLAFGQSATAYVGPLGAGMRNSSTFGDALQFVCSHSYAHSLAAWIWLKPSFSGMSTVVGHDILLHGLSQKSQAMEYILLVGHLATLKLSDGRVRAKTVLFRHQPLSAPRTYHRYFACDVRFGRSSDALIFSRDDMAVPIPQPNAQVRNEAALIIESRFSCRKPPLRADVLGVISHILGNEACTRGRVAGAVNLHSRTMQRRLVADGTSFQQIKDEVRRDRIVYFLRKTKLEMGEISQNLGFSEQAVMTRWCRKWFAKSPTALRFALKS